MIKNFISNHLQPPSYILRCVLPFLKLQLVCIYNREKSKKEDILIPSYFSGILPGTKFLENCEAFPSFPTSLESFLRLSRILLKKIVVFTFIFLLFIYLFFILKYNK